MVAKTAADLVLLNGRIYTVNTSQPFAEAVAVLRNRIVFVGTSEAAKAWIGPETRCIDLCGKLVLPGFNDAHVHFSDGGFSLIALQLRDAVDREDFARRIADYASQLPPGTWITGGNWDHERWPDKTYPDRWLIDPVSGDHPVLVNRLDAHLSVANSLALRIAGITKNTPDPKGGFIERHPETGEPTGILKDAAVDLVRKHIPPVPNSLRLQAIEAALKHAASLGVTSVQDMSPINDLRFYQQLRRKNKLTCRIYGALPIESHTSILAEARLEYGFGDNWLRLGALKCFSDGAMGSGSALFFEPYTDDPSTSGLAIYSRELLTRLLSEAHELNLQVCAHAIGDKANSIVLDAYQEAIRLLGQKELRHRIEHAQVVLEKDLTRFRELGIIASIQPSHCIDDLCWAEKRIGKERCSNAYRVQSFLDAGVHLAFGTDWPVETLNPFVGIYAAVAREAPGGGPPGGWYPKEKVSLENAIRCYTLGSAYAEHQEHEKGSIEPGKLADLVVLDRDLFTVSPQQILETQVEMTIVDGRIVFDRNNL